MRTQVSQESRGARPLSKYSKEQRTILLSVPMTQLLEHVGHNMQRSRSGLYYSFLHEEKNPSLHINASANIWYDHGAGQGGSVKEAVRLLIPSCANAKDEAVLDFLADNFFPGMIPANAETSRARTSGVSREELEKVRAEEARRAAAIEEARKSSGKESGEKRIQVMKTTAFTSQKLLSYFENQRFIPRDLLSRYCRQVHYRIIPEGGTIADAATEYYAAGFPNSNGGWALRNTAVKLSTASGVTVIDRNGRLQKAGEFTPTSRAVVLFEGFADFLSWLKMNDMTAPKIDAVVLNSGTNLSEALDFATSHEVVHCCLDNDDAGRGWTREVQAACESKGVGFSDRSQWYGRFNDVNEMWCSRCRSQQREAQESRTSSPRLRPERPAESKAPGRGIK